MSPSINHSYLCKKIIIEIEKSETWEAWPEIMLAIEYGMIPDVAVYERGKIRPDFSEDKIKCEIMPQLVIEIVSPSHSIHDLMLKANKFVKAGISEVWTIEPYGKIIYISTTQGHKAEPAGLIGYRDLKIDFSKIFE